MKCDLCGEEMKTVNLFSSCYDCGIIYRPTKYFINENSVVVEPDCKYVYEYNNSSYTPEEWQRVLKLKAFL